MCTKIDTIQYGPWGQDIFIFHFKVYEPGQYEGTRLKMYVRLGNWVKAPVSSKLWKIARIANPDLKPRTNITKTMFLKKMFRWSLKTMEPARGLEPPTYALRMRRSTS